MATLALARARHARGTRYGGDFLKIIRPMKDAESLESLPRPTAGLAGCNLERFVGSPQVSSQQRKTQIQDSLRACDECVMREWSGRCLG